MSMFDLPTDSANEVVDRKVTFNPNIKNGVRNKEICIRKRYSPIRFGLKKRNTRGQ